MARAKTLEKRQADPSFELLDAPAERGLRNVQGLGGPGEAAILGKCLGLAQESQIDLHDEWLDEWRDEAVVEYT